MSVTTPNACPCNSGEAFVDCCQPLLLGTRRASTAEQLMRSRYSAFVMRDSAYLRTSWHPQSCPEEIRLPSDQRWLGLQLKRVEAGGAKDTVGYVEFVARSKRQGRAHRLHETSRFERHAGEWVYVGGEIHRRTD